MNILNQPSLFLQITAPASAPGDLGLFSGSSSLGQLILVLMLVVFVAGMGSVINLSFTLMKMQRIRLLEKYHPEVLEKVGLAVPAAITAPWWKKVYDRLTDDVPIEQEAAIMLDHNYDGIHELDNNLPPWWKGVLYLSMAFAPMYIWFVHFSDYGMLQGDQYVYEMEHAEEEVKAYLATQENTVDESNVELLADAEALGKGRTVFIAKCAVCHGQAGEGGIGPNLTDEYWLHGGSIADVFKSIKYGIPEKGMIAWKNDLRPRDMQEVASFIKSIVGTDPANAKEPQGEEYTEEELSKK